MRLTTQTPRAQTPAEHRELLAERHAIQWEAEGCPPWPPWTPPRSTPPVAAGEALYNKRGPAPREEHRAAGPQRGRTPGA